MGTEPLERKLVAILYADVSGYSRLTGADEEGTHRLLSTYLDAITGLIEEHNGKALHFAGDAVLAEFASLVNALTCAVAIQHDLTARNQDLPDERKLKFRIGINLGDVIVDRNEIYGDGVNVAARLESLAEPGGICISDMVRQGVEGKLDLDFEDLGEQQVKNIDQPVRAYRAQLKPGATLPAPTVRAKPRHPMHHIIAGTAAAVVLIITVGVITWLKPWAPESEPSSVEAPRYKAPVAVLPFKNLSDDAEMESFADGLTEDIITDFAKFTDLFVIASNTVFTYKGKSINVQDVGRELGVRYVLEGSTEKTGDTIRITAQLVDASDGKHLWAERYDGMLTDKFTVRDKARWSIIANLLGGLGILSRAERQRAIEKPLESRDAYDYAQIAYEEMHKYTKEATVEAMKLAKKAVELDPEYASAHRLLSWVHYREAQTGWGGDRDRSLELAYEHARKAWELDPADYGSHWQLGSVYLKLGQHDQAVAAYERARELNPSDADLLADMAYPLILVGRAEEAIPFMKQAMQRKSNWPQWYRWTLAMAYWEAEQYQDALTTIKSITEPAPRVLLLASVYVRLGRVEEARAEVTRYLKANPGHTLKDIRQFPFKDPAKTEHYLDDLRKAGLPEEPSLSLPDKPSIAVLPFTNMSDDPKQEYFVDGMTEDLITDLSKLSALFVIARNSTFAYKGKSPDVRQVSRELGVKYVLEGSVRRAGEQVRINAQLIDATTGGHLWAERYDGSLADVFAMQDEVTQKIVTALAVNLTGKEQANQARSKTSNPQAYDAFLQGWEHYRRGSPEALEKSITQLEQATKRDPNYSRAYAALAAVYWRIYSNLWYGKVLGLSYAAPAFEKALEYLEEAKKAPSSLAHQVAAEMAAHLQRNPDKALAEAERALALDANDPAGHLAMAIALLKAGRPVEAEPRVREAMRLDPLYPASYLVLLAQAEFAMARYRDAAATLERAADIDPSNDKTFVYLTATYGYLGRQADAKAALERANQLRANAGWGAFTLFSVHKFSFLWVGDVKPFKEGLRKVGVPHGSGWFQLVKTVEGGLEVEGATKINVEEAKALYDQNAVFIDVSRVWRERIPGAHFLVNWHDGAPSEFNEVRLAKIADRKQKVVIYHGPGLDRDAAIGCAKALTWGFKNVYYLPGGLEKWKAAGYPVENSG